MTEDQRATLVRFAEVLGSFDAKGAATIRAALAEIDRLQKMLADWRAEAREQCTRAGRLAAENEALRANGPMPIAAEFVAWRRENADLRETVDRLTAENAAAREVIDALIAAGRGGGLSYYKCSAAHNMATDFDRKFGMAARLAAADGESS